MNRLDERRSEERVGIVLAGGHGSRLRPVTHAVNKQLLPVFDKPMIYYALSLLFEAGIRKVLIVTNPGDRDAFVSLLGDGSAWGASFEYVIQDRPGGLAHALLMAEPFIQERPCCLVLGDNVVHGPGLGALLRHAAQERTGATIFGVPVQDPRAFGVAECDAHGRVLSLEEKPSEPRSNLAVPGIYFFDAAACALAATLAPSARGELEITDLNRRYLERGALRLITLDDDVDWLDAGTLPDLMEAGRRVEQAERRRGTKIGSPELVAWRNGWLDTASLGLQATTQLANTPYGASLAHAVREERIA